MNTDIVISLIIVNYNVKDFLEQALNSVRRALSSIPAEIIVIDNASIDGSVQMLKQRFPDVMLIGNEKNIGFSAGNNLGLACARGQFLILLNPDTIVQEDTFTKLLAFFDKNPQASAATCKILNPDGSFSVDCRHAVPTPLTAFWKLTGLNRLFPKSKIFGKYNLTYLDENETHQVEAISGSFMMLRRSIVEKVGLLDESFFMYCEDIDYCHRINMAGGKIYYAPESQIIHYKGESTKKNNLDYVITFNRSLYQFYKKHYQQKYLYPFEWLILLGVVIRGMIIFLRNNLTLYYPILLDTVILNGLLFISFYLRYELKHGFSLGNFFDEYIIINIITSATYFLTALYFESVNRERYSINKIVKANLATFMFVSALTFFFNQFAFSRLIVLACAVMSPLFMVAWRLVSGIRGQKPSPALGRDFFSKRTLIVGFDDETRQLLRKLEGHVGAGLELSGIVSPQREDVGQFFGSLPVVASLDQLPDYLRLSKTNLIIFTTHNIPYQTILTTMSRIQNPRIEFKIVPDHLEFVIGKSNIERLDTLPLVDIEYAYGRLFNRFVKRAFDLITSLLLLILLLPAQLFILPQWWRRVSKQQLCSNNGARKQLLWTEHGMLLKWSLGLINVFRGVLSFVGAPIAFKTEDAATFSYKPGLTGLVQINRLRIASNQQRENYELHYLKNQNLFFDLEILIKSVINRF